MDDHNMYYDPPDLWLLLARSGFRPKNIKLFKHKFRLDTFAICSKTVAAFSIVDHSQGADCLLALRRNRTAQVKTCNSLLGQFKC